MFPLPKLNRVKRHCTYKGDTSRGPRRFLAQTIVEVSGRQLNPLRNFFLEHLKENITLIHKDETNHSH